ncbi:MAG: HEAT repeat domain-containing protein [Chloroflexi bacterium]|nr:HEAT repeat domain-containing protein [Chloroflexota bacterium]
MTRAAIEKIVSELGSSDNLSNSKLAQLSNLSSEDLEFLKSSWATIETKRRRQIVYRLTELAEDNLELNFDTIFRHCFFDTDEEVRTKAIDGVWENEEPSLINPLISLLLKDSSEKVQATAASALGKFAMLAEHKKLRPCHTDKIREALLGTINTPDKPPEVRRRALEAVAPLSLPEVSTAITNAYESGDRKFITSSIYAMGKNCDPSWLSTLLKELSSADATIRYEAAGACGELEAQEAVPYLKKLLCDADADVQMAAIQALGKIGGPKAKEFLQRCLNNTSQAIRQAAEQALSELRSQEDLLPFRI